MSIYLKFDVGPKGRRFRRAVDQDKADIARFWKKEDTETLFCCDNFGSLIELSTLAIVSIDEKQDVTGFLALCDHPPLPGIDPSCWEIWIRNMFRKYYLAYNTLFIHFICCNDFVTEHFLEEALISVFMNDFYLQQIILVVPPLCKIDCLAKYPCFKRRSVFRHCVRTEEDETCVSLFVAQRNKFCPKLKVRRAVEEDNDDVVDILDKHCKQLKELYGDYYVSEIISRHPEINRTIIVAEVNLKHQDKQKVVGAMCLNSEINYENLQRTYELSAYHGLMQADPKEREEIKRNNTLLETFGDPIMTGHWSPFDNMDKKTFVHEKEQKIKDMAANRRRSKPSKVNFKYRIGRRSTVHRQSTTDRASNESDKTFSPAISIAPDMSLMFLIDDEPLDYEIVNIDTVLFTLPEIGSVDTVNSNRMSQNFSGTRLKKKRSTTTKIDDTTQIFKGKPNAFIIELFALKDEIDDRRAFDMLEAAFECMPQYDYCIIRIPSAKKAFSLLSHFTVVPSRPHICCRYALYVAHRNSVLGKLRVRQTEIADIPQIAMLLHNVDGKETIWTIENAIQCHHQHLSYVFLSGYTIIGLGILDPPEHTDLIHARFNVEEQQYMKYHISGEGLEGGISMIKTVLAYPAFEPHFAFFARDMMRLSGSSSLLWLTAYRNKWVAHKANAIVTAMTPLPYRTRSSCAMMPELRQVYNLSKNILSFSAWLVSKKLTSIPKLNVDSRIVIVGASRTAIAFIYHLIFGDSSTYLTFTNVTLVSTNGLPYMRHPLHAAELMFPKYDQTSDRFLKSTPFTYYVNVIQATMVEINKQDKCIITEYGSRYYYDQLFLVMGKQYQHPHYFNALIRREKKIKQGKIPAYVRMDDPKFLQREPRVDYDTPENVFLINNVTDANKALAYVRSFFWRFDDYKVLVYGADINTYCCITALLELEVPPGHIIFVEPFPPEDENKPRVPFFCNNKVDQSVRSILDTLGITIHRGYYFQTWNADDYNVVYSVEFISHYNYLKLDCAAFFYYGKKFIDPNAFVAINKCGLAYDGGILIDHQSQTNDTCIYAAGPCTRYYRRYNSDDKQHKFYDSYDIGRMLGIQIRNQLDPLYREKKKDSWVFSKELNKSSSSSDSCRCFKSSSSDSTCDCSKSSSSSSSDDVTWYQCMVPKLQRPLVWHCILPGNLQYLEVRPPGTKFPHFYVQNMHHNGTVIETYKTGYFKVHINNNLIVDGITCLTPDTECVSTFKMLYGNSAVVLNNVHLRFMAGAIDDLYEFFREPWSVFLYNERSEELMSIVKHLKPKDNPDGKTLEDVLREISASLEEVKSTGDIVHKLKIDFEKNFEAITDYVIEWLTDNDLLLPLYVTPSNMIEFTHDLPRNPAFKRCRKTIKTMLAMIA